MAAMAWYLVQTIKPAVWKNCNPKPRGHRQVNETFDIEATYYINGWHAGLET